MKVHHPLVSVLLAVYNGESYLKQAIESILSQTYVDFEFIIINDGSNDKSEEIIQSFQDSRIKYVKNETNLKLIASLNKGLALCEGKYIARIDADDVALPQRLEKQVEFLEKKSEIGVLGTFAETLGLEKNYQIEFLTNHENIRLKLFFNNYLHHPTVMLRKDILLQNNIQYESCLHAEDYLLWLRLSKVTKIDILPEILLKYRIHEENISNVNKKFQKKQTHELRKLQLNELGLFPEVSVLEIYNFFIDEHKLQSFSDFEILIEFIQNVIQENKKNPILNEHLLFNFFKGKIKDFVELNCWERELKVNIYFKSIFAESKLNNFKIYIKHILRIKKIK